MTPIIRPHNRRGDRVAECAGLENRCAARYRGFESLPLRLDSSTLNESQKDAISRSGNGLRLVVYGESEDADGAAGGNRSQPESGVLAKKCDKNVPTESGQSSPTIDDVRQTVRNCDGLPDHIREAVLALLSTL